MNYYWRKFFSALASLVFFSWAASAQQAENKWEAGIGAGTMVYQGDLAPSSIGNFKRLKPAFSAYGGKMLSPYFSLRVNYSTGKIAADDADFASPGWRRKRNLNFSTSINELTAKLIFRPYGTANFSPASRFAPYFFAGTGVSFVDVKRDWSNISADMLDDQKTASGLAADTIYHLPSVIPSVPIGAGVVYTLSPSVSLFSELTYHVSITDYLDGFSNLGNSAKKDNYYMLAVGVHFNFSLNTNRRATKCPPVK